MPAPSAVMLTQRTAVNTTSVLRVSPANTVAQSEPCSRSVMPTALATARTPKMCPDGEFYTRLSKLSLLSFC